MASMSSSILLSSRSIAVEVAEPAGADRAAGPGLVGTLAVVPLPVGVNWA